MHRNLFRHILAICMTFVMLIGCLPLEVSATEGTGAGDTFDTATEIADSENIEFSIASGKPKFIKYTAPESTDSLMLCCNHMVELDYPTVYVEVYSAEDSSKCLADLFLYNEKNTESLSSIIEAGKTYVFKLYPNRLEPTLSFSIRKDTLSYDRPTLTVITVPGGTPELQISGAKSEIAEAEITYQWYEYSYKEITGATSSSYTLPAINVSSPRTYQCEISDGNFTETVTFDLNVKTGLTNGSQVVYARSGGEVTLTVNQTSLSEQGISYTWYASASSPIAGASASSYTYQRTTNDEEQYTCKLDDGYSDYKVKFTVKQPEIAGELPLDTTITGLNEETIYSFTPARSGFYKKNGFSDAVIYDSSWNKIDFFDLNAGVYFSSGKTYYVSLNPSTSSSSTTFTLLEEKELSDNTVKAGSYSGITWQLDSSGLLTFDGTGSVSSLSFNGLEHMDAGEIKKMVFAEGITGCGENYDKSLFSSCKNLSSVSFPSTLTYIGLEAFKECSSLREVSFAENSQLTDIGKDAFAGTPFIGEQSGDFIMVGTIVIAYNGTEESATIPEAATILGSNVMQGSDNLKNLYILQNLKKINHFSVAECKSIPEVNIPGNVTDIGYCAFYSDTALEEVVLNEGVKRIDQEAFYACTSLKEITIPKSVTYIGEHAIGYASANYTGTYTPNTELPTVKCYYATQGYYYAKNNNFPITLLDKKDLSQDSPLVRVRHSIVDGELQSFTVTFAEEELVENTDYTLSLVKGSDSYEITLTGIGEYYGTKTLTVNISSDTDITDPSDPDSGNTDFDDTDSDSTDPDNTDSDSTDPDNTDTTPHTHSYQLAAVIREATALETGLEEWECSCGETLEKETAKLPATGKLTATKLSLQVKKSVVLKVSGLAKGDSVKSWKSSNKKIATVNSKGKISAKKKGTTKITATLASGKKLQATVKVISDIVKTSKIKLTKSTVTLKRNKKYTLGYVLTPFNSQQKVTFKTSNKKVATVNSKGVITAKKKGTARITVTSGKKKAVCKVKVK